MALALLAAVIAIAAAGVDGTIHLSGPRLQPHFRAHNQTTTPTKAKVRPPTTKAIKVVHDSKGSPVVTLALIVIGLLAVVAAWLLWRWLRATLATREHGLRAAVDQSRVVQVTTEPEPDSPVLLSGIELALQALDEEREPADAVVRAWLGLQETAEESGIVRYPSETPAEFTARILQGAFTDDRAIRTLLRLYSRTRFGDHPVTADDVITVRAALAELVGSWGSGRGTPKPAAIRVGAGSGSGRDRGASAENHPAPGER